MFVDQAANSFDIHVEEKKTEASESISAAANTAKEESIAAIQEASTSGVKSVQDKTSEGVKALEMSSQTGVSNITAAVEEGKKNFVTDNTLAIPGRAADAKVTGDKIGELKEDLGNVVKITETKSTNKLNFTNVEEQEKNGITMSYQDNVLSLNGTAPSTTEFAIPLAENLSDGIYKFYYELLEGDFNQNILYKYQSNAYAQFTKNTTTVKDISINGQTRSKIVLTKDQIFKNCKFHIWAELSSEATGMFSIPGTTQKDISLNDNNSIKIFLITPFTVNNYSKQDTVNQIYAIGKEKEIAVIDANIAPFKYTVIDGKIHEYDITHLSEMGYFLLANVIVNGMGKGIYDYLEKYNEC